MTTGTAVPEGRATGASRRRSVGPWIRRTAGPVFSGPPADPQRLTRRLRLLAVAVRWVTIGLGLLVGALRDPLDARFLAAAVALVALALLLLARPLVLDPPGRRARLTIALELAVTAAAVAATGGLDSPFVVTPMVPIVLSGYVYALNRRLAFGVTVAGMATAAAVLAVERSDPATQQSAALMVVVFLLAGVIGAFARLVVTESVAERAAAIDQVSRLATANELLVALHGVARTLPASLDLEEVVASIRGRLRSLIDYTALVLFIRDEAGHSWNVALAEGVRLPPRFTTARLPSMLRQIADGLVAPPVVDDLLVLPDQGCSPLARSGLYFPLRARGGIVGLLAIEHTAPRRYGTEQVELLASLAGLFGLSLDNALWFGRLRRFGAEAERARIARDLHDRIAQSLAYVAFELERLASRDDDREVAELHGVVRGVVGELRETLFQLRAGVTDDEDLATVAGHYLARFEERTGIGVDWQSRVIRPLPYQVEQEVWRILQEALTNVERHSGARSVRIRWVVDEAQARLEVTDSGSGFDARSVPGDRYGIVGMRERAGAIGARLDLDSPNGEGTRLTVTLDLAG